MFSSEPKLVPIEGRPGWWTLDEDLQYHIQAYDGDGGYASVMVQIPAGFETDLASTPRWLWPVLPPFGSYLKATVLHDYLYRILKNRFLADALFRVAMRKCGTIYPVRLAMYCAVRVFGGRHQGED